MRRLPLVLLALLCCPFLPSAHADTLSVVPLRAARTRLDEIGLYSVSYRYRDGRAGAMPIGWTGGFTDETGIACEPDGVQDGKPAFLIHPPWRGGTGVTDQTFRLALPNARHLTLRFAVAMRRDAVAPGKSDGATFRVFLNDRPLLDRNKTDAHWSTYQYDLTPWADHTVTLRFETDPGPRNDSSFDFAEWGDREIVGEGLPVTRPVAAPISLYALHTRFGLSRNWLVGGWTAVAGPQEIPLAFGASLDLVASDGRVVSSDAPEVQASVRQSEGPAGSVVRQLRYTLAGRTINVRATLSPVRAGLARIEVQSEDPYIAAVRFGAFGPVAYRRQVIVPYLGTITYLPDLGLFGNVVMDYTHSQASALDGTTALYGPLTDGRRSPVHETAEFALSPWLSDVLPSPPNPPSPYRALLSDKVILDVWGGRFADNAAWLHELASYHLTHFLTIAHVWQHGGYDNQLPNVLPAEADLGGDAGMRDWVQTATGLGERIALHENYVDFYPNAPTYTEADVAHDSQNHLVPAWKNLIQSYAVAPTAIFKYARMFTPDVHARYGTNAAYLDVHSAVPPWFHVDYRADVPGAGKFHTVWDAHRALWRYFRAVHGGPVLGEGANHWYWSGLLDGVEAQFGVGVPGNGGETAPLFVDFDLDKIHPLQFNHGMGYLERWLPSEQGGTIPPILTLDQYRMQEIAYGHAGFVASILWHSLPFVWQEHNLVWPVTARYAAARPVSIQYEDGGRLRETSAAIAAGTDFRRVQIRYDSGLTVRANGQAQPWAVGGVTLPQFGWLAEGAGVRAGTTLLNGVVADFSRTADTLFLNARSTVPETTHRLAVAPSVAQFAQTGPRRFRIQFAWDVRERIPPNEASFVHVTGPGGQGYENIVFQSSAGMNTPPDQWPVGQVTRGQSVDVTLPDGVGDGRYEIRLGLYSPRGGSRLSLAGQDDGSHRIIVGVLTVSDQGRTLSFQAAAPVPMESLQSEAAARAAHTNPARRLVRFGPVATNGSLLLERQRPGLWLLTPFPRDAAFTVALDAASLDPTLSALRVEALDVSGRVLRSMAFAASPIHAVGWRSFQTIPGAIRYRLHN